jgi:hypothetical protein
MYENGKLNETAWKNLEYPAKTSAVEGESQFKNSA